jgi:type VI secretion system protein ImpM
MKLNPAIGFYGKLPMQSEMLSENLPAEFITPWQDWLQTALTDSHENLGLDWLNSYLTAPIWRFILSAGLCGDSAWAGILLPSVDKVGHYFPLTVVAPFEQSQSLPHLFTLGNHWFEQLEAMALSGLEDKIDLPQFVQLLEAVPVFPLSEKVQYNNQTHLHDCVDQKSTQFRMQNMNQVSEAFVGMNACLQDSFLSSYSLWVTSSPRYLQSALSVFEGLPPAQSFSAFINSNSTRPKNTSHKPCKKWESWAVTDIGKRRQHNEDAYLAKPELCLWAVADGMGGHKAGDVASQLIVSSLKKISLEAPLEARIHAVKHCLQLVNSELRQFAREQYEHHIVGSTVVVLVCEEDYCAVLWAGDSRLYRLRNKMLQQLTQDHSADYGKGIKNSNLITKAIGATESLDVDCHLFDVQEGDLFLLCSDGLDKELGFTEIEQVMKTSKPQDIADTLMTMALNKGARDNVTVVVVNSSSV